MIHRRRLIALAAVAAAVPALAAPVGAEADICYKALPGPGSHDWVIQEDGSQEIVFDYESGSNFDENHGALKVNGAAYPAIPNGDNACTTTATSIQYPTRVIGGVSVSRTVTSVDGRIRRIDRLVNNSDAQKLVDVDFAVRVQGSQVAVGSESGDSDVTSIDHWSVHENDGSSYPFLQWGQDGAPSPTVVSLGNDPQTWTHTAGNMPDATFEYEDIPVPAHTALHLLHMNGTTTDILETRAAAKDTLTPFKGLTKAQASVVYNWGADPDGDNVHKLSDDCPGVKGNSPNGCLQFESKPVDIDNGGGNDGGGNDGGGNGGETTPPAGNPPATTPPATTPTPTPPSTSPSDLTAPVITIKKLGRSVKRSRLAGKGLAPRIACDEACSIKVTVKGRARGKRRAATLLTKSAAQPTTATRTVKLKLKARKLRRLGRITIVVTATDAAGNRRSVTRVVRLAR